jgi:release factor glutamine methyltransferase
MATIPLALWLRDAEKRLSRVLKDQDLAHQDVAWIAMHTLKKDRAQLFSHAEKPLTGLQRWKLEYVLRRRLKDEPLAYLLNSAPFYGREFYVDKRVLIPRGETEDLLELAIRRIGKERHVNIVDIGTGSGALAISLALEIPNAKILASDTSLKALQVAKKNAKKLGVKIRFSHGKLLHEKLLKQIGFDLPIVIVANLPYLPLSDKQNMPESVTRYEPSKALFASHQGMSLNSGLLAQASAICPKLILLEFDPPQAKELRDYAKSLFPNATIRIHQDRCGRDRILEISNN